ncbi:TPA: hypothetical protein I7787_01790 [Vibrio vulnificus]|uniref:hypothetical protein n=1 Tax=Vibrio vulnificus TaxID=672 RepID=UPI000BA87E77|nr:hypothetical protein [Vibrio vulnificus]EGR0231135.1 hypothetical protein [Vibrio vulnificus]EIV8493803.1 hypothetical protein [Vibrio vulnificus]EJE8669404.1 hypothetical protein [Vibrio vulnificus]ELK5316527.1 hypothetical protein [Vibrio vulnificus]ELV8673123.1 hypothetical protein [Vibrio vulnificus]
MKITHAIYIHSAFLTFVVVVILFSSVVWANDTWSDPMEESMLNKYIMGRVFVEQYPQQETARCHSCLELSVIEFDTQTRTALYSHPGGEEGYTSIYKYEDHTIRLNGLLLHIKLQEDRVALETESGVVFLSN